MQIPKKPWDLAPRTQNEERKGNARKGLMHLWEHHHEIKRLLVLGYKPQEIAQRLGMHVASIKSVIEGEMFQEELAIMSVARDQEVIDIAAEIREAAPDALETLKGIMKGDLEVASNIPYSLRLSASKDLLDRGGYAAPKVIYSAGVQAHITKEDLIEIHERAKRMGIETSEQDEEGQEDEARDGEFEEVG